MIVLIKSIIYLDSELVNLFSDTDGYSTPFETAIPKSSIIEGITSLYVPDGTNIIRIMEDGLPSNYVDTPVGTIEDFNFTSKIPPPPAFSSI